MEKIVGLWITIPIEVKDGMTDDDIEDLAVQKVLNEHNSDVIEINGVEIVDTFDS